MIQKDKQKLQEAYKILRKWGGEPCKEFAFGCQQCLIDRFLVEFESLINFYID